MKLRLPEGAKRIYTLSVSKDLNEDWDESYNFLSLETLIDTIKENLENEFCEYDVANGLEQLTPEYIDEQLDLGYGHTLTLVKARCETSTFFEALKPSNIVIGIGSDTIY